jgi:DNA-binding transcriptional LysR family regulator
MLAAISRYAGRAIVHAKRVTPVLCFNRPIGSAYRNGIAASQIFHCRRTLEWLSPGCETSLYRSAIATARRAAKGEIGRLGIGFIGHSTYLFLPALLRKYKALYPGVVLRLDENVPSGQDEAFDRGEIDIGFTRTLPSDRQPSFSTKVILREPLLVAFPRARKVKAKRIRIADLASERFVIFQRASSPAAFDTIIRTCNDQGFSPNIRNELNAMQSVLSAVEADEGVAVVPASARNLRCDNVDFFRLQPDEVRIDLLAAWPSKEPSVALRTFLELLSQELPAIRKRAGYARR